MARTGEEPPRARAEHSRGAPGPAEVFARVVCDYARRRGGSGPIAVLEAGCGRSAASPGVDALRGAGFAVRATGVDEDHPLTRAAWERRRDIDAFTLGDLRTLPLTPRSVDIIHCAGLLERIRHVELVLDRFVAALKPGGMLLLRITVRDSGAGAIDRFVAALPRPARDLAWRRLQPGEPGPYPAVYEPVVSEQGIHGYALVRGLVTVERHVLRAPIRPFGAAGHVLAALSRLVAGVSRQHAREHAELLYVLRRPEDRFARVV